MSPEWFATMASSARSLVGELGWEALFSTIVFAIVLCLYWIPRRLGWPSLSHALWALVLLRLVLPTDLSVPWSARSILDRSALSAHVEGFDTELR
ncbi:MAG: hypothetical protein GY856_23390, partial [bacterium]|nr:hypothetical protein [bacterium]